MKIVYFAHDLEDSAIHRRARMLTAGGARVTLVGFRRGAQPTDGVEGFTSIDLGRTDDGLLARRAFSVARALVNLGNLAAAMQNADIVLARNLEMLVIAARARKRYAGDARLVYECLDIHRLLLSPTLKGFFLRWLESSLWRETDLLLTSSPAFIDNYFGPRKFSAPIELVENKVFFEDGGQSEPVSGKTPHGPPWRIGWYGMLRCRKSLEILIDLSRRANGAVEVVLRGKPSGAVFADLQSEVANLPHLRFEGPYRNPGDLPRIYSEVHFTWAIDFFEQGQNSSWLLPNRLYEATLCGSVPIALAGVETSSWLQRHGVGVVLEAPLGPHLIDFFDRLDQDDYASRADRIRSLPRRDVSVGLPECRALVTALSNK